MSIQPMDIRERLELHARACRMALADGQVRPCLPADLGQLFGADLAGANLVGADLAGADFGGADLAGVNFTHADLAGVNFGGADLAGADFGGADLAGVNFTHADLAGVNFGGADLAGARLGRFILASGEARTISGSRYPAFTASSESGRLLRYGCVTLPVAEWRKRLGDLCRQHVPGDEARHETQITALLAYCDALDAIDSMPAKKAEWGGA